MNEALTRLASYVREPMKLSLQVHDQETLTSSPLSRVHGGKYQAYKHVAEQCYENINDVDSDAVYDFLDRNIQMAEKTILTTDESSMTYWWHRGFLVALRDCRCVLEALEASES